MLGLRCLVIALVVTACAKKSAPPPEALRSADERIAEPSQLGATPEAPAAAPPTGHVVAIGAGDNSTCALLSSGQVMCWGDAARRGNGGRPQVVAGIEGATQLAVGSSHRCVLVGAAVQCWGDNGLGQLGTSARGGVAVPIADGAVAVAAGSNTSCAVLRDGAVTCWGYALSRVAGADRSEHEVALGGEPPVQREPVAIPGAVGAKRLALGHWAACLVGDKAPICWGSNHGSQLGDVGEMLVQPAATPALAGLDPLVLGEGIACGVSRKGQTLCTGFAVSQANALPRNASGIMVANSAADLERWAAEQDRMAAERGVARHIAELDGAVGFGLGQFHSCAVLRSGGVRCWGGGKHGELGTGSAADRATPIDERGLPPGGSAAEGRCGSIDVVGLRDAVAVTVGMWHSCALTRGGQVLCWGINGDGQLGDGGGDDRVQPVAVVGLPADAKHQP
jgi:alpha-tubulin suppressor-like RCC1 family protein